MYIGIDIGGTNTRIGLFEDHKTLVNEIEFLTEKNYEKGLEKIVENIRKIAGEVQIHGVGLGVCGVVDIKSEKITISAQLNDWAERPLKK
jgi:glucokinase